MISALLLTCAMAIHDGRVELKNAPVTVSLHLKRAHNPKKHLMLRIEGISVEGEVGVWEVRVGNTVAGTLSTYGVEEQNGKFVASVQLDMVRSRSVAITFAPTAHAAGTIRFQRLRLVEE
jgi:acyl-coenzyme A thioesterase PaaI-like protein